MSHPPASPAWAALLGSARVVGIVLSIGLAASFLGLYLTLAERSREEAVADSRRDVAGITATVTDQLSRIVETTDIVLLELGRQLQETGRPWDADTIGLRLRQLPHLRALLVTDRAGRVRFSTVESLVGLDLGNRAWAGPALRGEQRVMIGAPEPGRFPGPPGPSVQQARRWTIPLARPAGTGNAGAVVALINPDHLIEIGQRIASTFEVTVRFHGLDGTLLAESSGSADAVGQRNAGAWMFRDFLPRLDSGLQRGPDSAGHDGVAGFGVTTSGAVVVEVAKHIDAVLEPAVVRATELAIGIGIVAGSTLLFVLLLVVFGIAFSRQQQAARDAERQRSDSEREAAMLRASRAEVERLLGGLPAIAFHVEVGAGGGAIAYRRIGGNVEQVTGWPGHALRHPQDWAARMAPGGAAEPFDQFIDRVRLQGQASRELRLRQPDGGWRWLRTVAMVLGHGEDGAAEIVGYTSDITTEHESAVRLATAGRLASLGEMATGLAHELRQPLTIMSLAAQNLRKALDAGRMDAARPRADRIVEQAERAGNIIEHLRRFARGSEDGAAPEPVSVETAVQGALTLVAGTLRDADIRLDIRLGDPPPVVMGHLVGIEQVLVNLLVNASHALQARGPETERRITLEAIRRDDQVAVEVRDTGGGIPAHVLARMFEPFVTTKDPDKGTGLGLSICHGLVAGMGGTITARNEAAGAVFTITLRAAPVEAQAAA
jgi:signal transduction histidine kinase